MTTDDAARRSAAHRQVDVEIERVQKLIHVAAAPRPSDTRRLIVLQRALGDLVEALACGQDFDCELAILGASVQEWQEDRLAMAARCCCPIMPGVGFEDRIALPGCPAHGEAAA